MDIEKNYETSNSNSSSEPPKAKNTPFQVRLPLLIALSVSAGMLIGAKFFRVDDSSSFLKDEKRADLNILSEKIKQILFYVEQYYVDTANVEEVAEVGIAQMLQKLDPHTAYIPIKDTEVMNAQLEGDFEGVGIEFNINRDTLLVVTPISGGPSEAVGLRAGDKIIEIDGKNVAGVKITTRDVFSKLRGKKGTKVELGILRKGQKDKMNFTIIRDKIPTHTVDVSYMIDKKTGYIKISRFGEKTYDEFNEALKKLIKDGMSQLLLDLRGNPGGYLDRAVKIADEMIANDNLIVYTDGKGDRFDMKEKASFKGLFEKGTVVVLIDEGSASASEIVAGALQDNDRALIVGRRSFGKGLVQKPIRLLDGSELRLTISRYYTPSGRCIQKPYEEGTDYDAEIYERYKNGEVYKLDSSKFDASQRFKTSKGRTVYGGGGITPDVFIPNDTSYITPMLQAIYGKTNAVRDVATDYVNANKNQIQSMGFEKFKKTFTTEGELETTFLSRIKAEGVTYNEKEYQLSRSFVLTQIKAHIARLVWHNEGFYPIFNENDDEFMRAYKLFEEAKKIDKSF